MRLVGSLCVLVMYVGGVYFYYVKNYPAATATFWMCMATAYVMILCGQND